MSIAVEIASQPGNVAVMGMKKIIPIAHAELDGHRIVTLADIREMLATGDIVNHTTLREVKTALAGVNINSANLAEQIAAIDYADAITSLPEAADHPRAALQIINTHNAKTLPAPEAARFLRGLPSETAEKAEQQKASTMSNTSMSATDKTLLRKLELSSSGLAMRANNGGATEADMKQLKAVNYSLSLVRNGTHVVKAIDMAGVDLDRLK